MKHLARLGREVVAYSRVERAWWLLPLMIVLGVVGLAMSVTSATVPIAVYTLF